MILFKTIRWKNFLSTGNQFTEVSLTQNNTNLIIGSNGSGKSTVLDALTFSLFGKPFRKINKPQLINSINEKDCVVEVEFDIGKTEWRIVRGIKPNIFVIYRDGKALDQQSSANDQQKWFEKSILKMNYKSFTQIVILGSSTFIPFMQLTANNRREVIEDLLDIKIFSSMNFVIKEKIRQLREQIKTMTLKKDNLNDKIIMQKNFIEKIEKDSEFMINTKNNRIDKLEIEMLEHMKKTDYYDEEIKAKQFELESFEGAKDKLRKMTDLKGKLSNKVSTITKEHKFFTENTVCPTCTQSIEEDFRINKVTDAQNKAKELQSGYQELLDSIEQEEQREHQFTQISKEITSLTYGISTSNTCISEIRKQVKNLESEIQGITKQLANRTAEDEKLESFQNSLSETYDKIATLKTENEYCDFSYSLLKDGGVKSQIIKKYLPLINQQVNRYLQMMDFYINFSLDEEFNETVESPIHENFSYASFSEGEKMRIDLALLFTWREVAKVKNSVNTNLLIMDEVFDSSLDGIGTDEFLKIIRYVIKDANIFVISHKVGMEDKFESVTRFEKIKGFSRIVR